MNIYIKVLVCSKKIFLNNQANTVFLKYIYYMKVASVLFLTG